MKELFLKLNEGISVNGINQIFDHVEFISFNYDRCIKHFLLNALRTYYHSESVEKIEQIMQALHVYHPYGKVGDLSWETKGGLTEFGGRWGASLLNLASEIKTYSEQVEDETLIKSMRNSLGKADTIVFLGFPFHDQNMKLLQTGIPDTTLRNIYATTYGMSASDKVEVEKSIQETFKCGSSGQKYEIILEDKTCFEFLKDYRRSL